MECEEVVKVWTQQNTAARMPGLLVIIGMRPERVYCIHYLKRRSVGCKCGGFWARIEKEGIEVIAREAKQAYRQKAKTIKTWFIENHEQAVVLIKTYSRVKKIFASRGVFL